MTIREFIQIEVLLPRIQRNGVLVLYDPERRYRQLCHSLAALAVPAQFLSVDAIPVLGTGKVNFRGVQKLVEQVD